MSALNILREIKAAARMLGPMTVDRGDSSVEWGSMRQIEAVGLDNMNRREIKNHLEARDLSTNGTRKELVSRLRDSLSDEKMRQFAAVENIVETKNAVQSDVEERGSVYVCGSNSKGELGLGDRLPKRYFTVIPSLRGVGVSVVVAGMDMTFAITEEHDVYVWGGGGFGRTGLSTMLDKTSADKPTHERRSSQTHSHGHRHDRQEGWLQPQLLTDLVG
jgi:alpha-tubulin suppressor-like RCC1 family protein